MRFHPTGRGHEDDEDGQEGCSTTANAISYRIDWRLTGLAGPDYHATISFGLPFEPEDSQYGKYRPIWGIPVHTLDRTVLIRYFPDRWVRTVGGVSQNVGGELWLI